MCTQFQKPYTNNLKIEVPVGTCRFVHIYQRNPLKKHHFSSSAYVNKISLCSELSLKMESQFQKIIFLRDFEFDKNLFSFLNHFKPF